jgi:hypothetical protein
MEKLFAVAITLLGYAVEKLYPLGAVIAVAISWSENKSVMDAVFHGVLSWLYVIYYSL